jgi:hypothetical protein
MRYRLFMTQPDSLTDKQQLLTDRWAAATGGDLWDYLAEVGAGASSIEDATFRIRRTTGIKVSIASIRVWVRANGHQ